MNLLGGYGSDSDSGKEDVQPPPAKVPRKTTNGNKKIIDFSKLPVRRPLLLDDAIDDSEAPLKKAAEAENLRSQAGKSLLAALPPPRVTLGLDCDLGGGGSRLDLSDINFGRSEKKREISGHIIHTETSIMGGASAPETAENVGLVPDHPMFRNTEAAVPDGPSLADINQMKDMKFMNMPTIKATDVQDPNWYMNNLMSGGPGLHAGKTVGEEVSAYEQKSWEKTTHANPSKVQKKKHQINWMAHEAMEKEAEMLDRAASSRLTKSQTSMKYGW